MTNDGYSHLTLAEAQAWCKRADTHGGSGTSRWFDGYDYMWGCAPDTDAQPAPVPA